MRLDSVSLIALATLLAACGNKIDGEGGGSDDPVIDIDGDGSPSSEDCDDGDASAYPGALELCDGVDNDCDGGVDNGAVDAESWYTDGDGDGWGADGSLTEGCDRPAEGTADYEGDCNDADPAYHPGAYEGDCNDPNDYNCDGSVGYSDADGDGFSACDDCDDDNAQVNPGASEVCNDIDDDCDALIDADDTLAKGEGSTWYTDADGDGHGDPDAPVLDCEQPDDTSALADDCDDANADVSPRGAEVCNGVDDDCDGLVDGADDSVDAGSLATWYTDADGDGYGDDARTTVACDAPSAVWVLVGGDCDDGDSSVNPGAAEVCDDANVDEDCDGAADDADASATGEATWYIDYDADGYGSPDYTQTACDQPRGYVDNADDCDDGEGEVNPAAAEICDDVDNDCNTLVDEDDPALAGASTFYTDADSDGYGDPAAGVAACEAPDGAVEDAGDCDDTDGDINPAATEICDGGVDNDCDGLRDDDDGSVTGRGTWYTDADEDGYGLTSSATTSCLAPTGTVAAGGDCDDGDELQHPGADETCNDEDDDCDGTVDEDAVDGAWSAVDEDGDGFGAEGSEVWSCESTVTNVLDCDDSDPDEPVVVSTADGSPSGEGTLGSPLDTIQAGIDAAYVCVVVEAGTYSEALDFGGKDVIVSSLDGPEATIIDATGLGAPVVTFDDAETDDAGLVGFTLTGGTGNQEDTSLTEDCTSVSTCTTYTTTYCGGGLFIDGAGPLLEDLIVSGNALAEYSETKSGDDTYEVYSFGGGLCAIGGASPELVGVSFQENFADQGGGIYIDESSAVTLDQTSIIANEATDGAGIEVDGGELILDNVASMWNAAADDAGGILGLDGEITLTNVTMAGDDGGLSGALYASGATTTTLLNAILYGDSSLAIVTGDGSATFDIRYSNVYNASGSAYSGLTDPTGSSGNHSEDPVFASWSDDGDWTNDDLHLDPSSGLIDEGTPDSAYSDADGTRNDMGAYGGPGGSW